MDRSGDKYLLVPLSGTLKPVRSSVEPACQRRLDTWNAKAAQNDAVGIRTHPLIAFRIKNLDKAFRPQFYVLQQTRQVTDIQFDQDQSV